jgi:hypothetical protein
LNSTEQKKLLQFIEKQPASHVFIVTNLDQSLMTMLRNIPVKYRKEIIAQATYDLAALIGGADEDESAEPCEIGLRSRLFRVGTICRPACFISS